jgi:hypothetical protein
LPATQGQPLCATGPLRDRLVVEIDANDLAPGQACDVQTWAARAAADVEQVRAGVELKPGAETAPVGRPSANCSDRGPRRTPHGASPRTRPRRTPGSEPRNDLQPPASHPHAESMTRKHSCSHSIDPVAKAPAEPWTPAAGLLVRLPWSADVGRAPACWFIGRSIRHSRWTGRSRVYDPRAQDRDGAHRSIRS